MSNPSATSITTATRAVLFDFDGTLADTAPDMAAALNAVRASHDLAPLSVANIRPHVSHGVRGMLRVGFELAPEDSEFAELRVAFFAHYERHICVETRLFPGMVEVLAELEERNIPWGIVTNKATRYAAPIVAALGLAQTAACLVCGDTTPHTKPHPEPLLHACRLLDVAPCAAIYVGDDERDVQAARSANIRSIAARYGYIGLGSAPETWQAGAIIDDAAGLLAHI